MNAVLYPSGRFLQKFQLMPRNAADIHRDIMEVKLQIYIAFAFNAKTFAIAILVLFFFHFSFSSLFWTDGQKLFSELFIISYQGNKWPRSDSSLDTLKSLSVKIVDQVVIRDECGTWHSLCTVTSIHSIQKNTRNSQKLGNKLASGWQKIQGSNREKSSW